MSSDTPDMPAAAPSAPSFDAAYADDIDQHLVRGAPSKDGAPGKVLPSLLNICTILRMHPEWVGVIGFDEFAGRVMKRKPGPHGGGRGEWADIDDIRLTLWLSNRYSIEPKRPMVMDAVQATAEDHAYHEVREYLSGLAWDGTPRLAKYGWLHVYLGADPTPYNLAAGTKWMIGAVARIFRPACKMDTVLVLEGAQGIGKSTAFKVLADPWFSESPLRLGDRESMMLIRGVWINELGELDSFNRAESTTAKNWFSTASDRYRSPWGKRPQDVPRQCVFAGTTNESIWLKDPTGNRRYWPVAVARVDVDELARDRNQLWAEAVHLYREGVPWHVGEDESALFDIETERRLVGDAFEERLRRWLEDHRADPELLRDGVRQVTMQKLLGTALAMDVSKWTRAEQTRVGQVMSRIRDWPKRRLGPESGRYWAYVYEPAAVDTSEVPL